MKPQSLIEASRRTGTHADVLAAIGLADLLSDAGVDRIRLRATEASFGIELSEPVTDELFKRIPRDPGYLYVRPNEKAVFPPEAPEGDRLDYPAVAAEEKRRRELARKLREIRKAGQYNPEIELQLAELTPRHDWRRYQAFNLLQGDETANRVYVQVRRAQPADFPQVVEAGIQALSTGEGGPEWNASPVQLFTPTWAKGYAGAKPDTTDRNRNVNKHWVQPFEEWLKYRGYFRAACPYFVGPKGEHIRLICPIPQDVSFVAFNSICDGLLRLRIFGSNARVDVLSVLELARIMVEHCSERGPVANTFPGLTLHNRTPADVVSGVYVTLYQSLGQSRAVASMSTLALPGWFRVENSGDAQAWLDILEEHRKVITSLRDDRSDEIGLVVLYRRFLEQRSEAALLTLLDFMGAYGSCWMRGQSQQRRMRRFQTDYLERIVNGMSQPMSEVLLNPGFKAVAAAVRRATVSAWGQKAMKAKNYREIRYELLSDLRRKRSVPGSGFLDAVSDFVSSYNLENVKRRDMGLKAPGNVTTDQFQQFVELLDDPERVPVVGALLCAYASCRQPYEPDTDPDAAPDSTHQDENPADDELDTDEGDTE